MTDTGLVQNKSVQSGKKLDHAQSLIAGVAGVEEVQSFLSAFPDYQTTPLVELKNLAQSLGLDTIMIKDESGRYGLSSFKALGGAYAVARVVHRYVEEKLGREVKPSELTSDECKAVASQLTICCATDGNHGRSVASGAEKYGCRCVIFLHENVTQGREDAIARFGAEIIRTKGNYDDSVAQSFKMAEENGWMVISDFSRAGYIEIPGLVMQGYTLMLNEIWEQSRQDYSHIFIQAGVGGLAAVVAGFYLDKMGDKRPKLVVVEPERANCLQRSAQAGRAIAMEPGEETIMAMLECYEPSLSAWEVLEKAADYFLTVGEDTAVTALKQLAHPLGSDTALEIGESGASGLAGLLTAAANPAVVKELGLNKASRVLLVGTEGATDEVLYQQLLAS
ncbi:diaminopropionate ammonia-lyase [Brucella sp. BE17]|uniref:diaminopropionate ammonia-lyase n=1 Tax=Brucella sp. BE17 TaxID=3142977 RepID=UPI0031BABA40